MTADGHTVVMCTHLLLEAEGLADQVVVLEDGTDLISGTPEELTDRYWPGAVVRLDAEEPEHARPAGHRRRRASPTSATRRRPRSSSTTSPGSPTWSPRLAADGVRLTRVEPRIPTLEDLYFAVREGRHGLRRGQLARRRRDAAARFEPQAHRAVGQRPARG